MILICRQAHTHGYSFYVPPVWELFWLALDAPRYAASLIRSFAPEAIDYSIDIVLAVKAEMSAWASIVADATLPTWYLLKSSSFAWAFYLMNISLSRAEVDRVVRLKVLIVPSSIIYVMLSYFPQWVLPTIFCILVWLVIAIRMDMRRMQDQYEAEARLRVLRGQGVLKNPSTFSELNLPVVEPERDFHNTECIICLESFADAPTSEPILKYTSPCGHTFHQTCLVTWFNTSRDYKCPTCRQSCNPTIAEYAFETIF